MPLYYLYTRQQGNSGWTYSGYQMQVTGGTNNGVSVNIRTWSKTPPPNPGSWQNVTGVNANGNGNPNSPQNGDTLSLPTTVGGDTITGGGTYNSAGTQGAGYYTDLGAEGDEGDWCAGSN